ncbi:uroporphyrinogen-III C-methyltransferase [Rhodovibrionaceae bacterium A322]
MMKTGTVYLVGAGPGDPELLTLKAARLIGQADVLVYDRLVSAEVLKLASDKARRIFVGKEPNHHAVPQEDINAILIEQAKLGHKVVRLKGGDPFIFGRGSEEAAALVKAGIAFEVAPGITAAQGCAAHLGVPLTHRGLATGVRYVTGHCREDTPLDLDWAGLADSETTLVVYMGAANIAQISDELIAHGLPLETPVLAVNNGTTPRERRLRTTLDKLPQDTKAADFSGPVLFIIGAVAALYDSLNQPKLAFLADDLSGPLTFFQPAGSDREAAAIGSLSRV